MALSPVHKAFSGASSNTPQNALGTPKRSPKRPEQVRLDVYFKTPAGILPLGYVVTPPDGSNLTLRPGVNHLPADFLLVQTPTNAAAVRSAVGTFLGNPSAWEPSGISPLVVEVPDRLPETRLVVCQDCLPRSDVRAVRYSNKSVGQYLVAVKDAKQSVWV